jgi:hypothetical protein
MVFFWLQCAPLSQVSDTPPPLALRMCFELSGSIHTARWSTCVFPLPRSPWATSNVLPLSFEIVVLVSPHMTTLSSFGSMTMRP